MDAIEFLKERKRMCTSRKGCDGCPLEGTNCVLSYATDDEDYERIIATVEQWSKEHPRKTRQTEILKMFPEAHAPEEVLPKDRADEIALKLMRLADLENICSYTRLRELAEADKDGRLVVLPEGLEVE